MRLNGVLLLDSTLFEQRFALEPTFQTAVAVLAD